MKVIPFSLWGHDPKYCVGAVRNAELAAELYPDWKCWFYFRRGTDQATIDTLNQFDNVETIAVNKGGDWTGMFDRFLPVMIPAVEVMLSRDCDSRLNEREVAAVNEWLESDKGFHIMRDHPWHSSQILGGMWGIKQGCLPEFGELMQNWNAEDRWQTDQEFLNAEIYPRVVHNAMVHASHFKMEPWARPFPTPRNSQANFVGESFDSEGNRVDEHVRMLQNAEGI